MAVAHRRLAMGKKRRGVTKCRPSLARVMAT
jgi:hypothetical protein